MNKDTKILEELLVEMESYLDSNNMNDDMKLAYQQKLKERLFIDKPECFVMIKGKGRDLSTILPVCNRAGIQDPRVIQFSIGLAKKMQTSDKVGLVDPASLKEAIEKLEGMNKEYLEEKKQTRYEKIKDYLKTTRGK